MDPLKYDFVCFYLYFKTGLIPAGKIATTRTTVAVHVLTGHSDSSDMSADVIDSYEDMFKEITR